MCTKGREVVSHTVGLTKEGDRGQEVWGFWTERRYKWRLKTRGGGTPRCLGKCYHSMYKAKFILILERIFLPNMGIWYEGMRRNELEKERPLKEQVKGGIWKTGCGFWLWRRERDDWDPIIPSGLKKWPESLGGMWWGKQKWDPGILQSDLYGSS